MSNKPLIRVWQPVDLAQISSCTMIAGQTGADCSNCKEVGIPFESKECPHCKTTFRYICSRNFSTVKEADRLRKKRPDLIIIDFSDYKYHKARKDATNFLS